jgi:hypothetical protein
MLRLANNKTLATLKVSVASRLMSLNTLSCREDLSRCPKKRKCHIRSICRYRAI